MTGTTPGTAGIVKEELASIYTDPMIYVFTTVALAVAAAESIPAGVLVSVALSGPYLYLERHR